MNISNHPRRRGCRVGVVGLGTIGKRLADAVGNLSGFELAGVAVRRATPALAPLIARGIPVYASQGIDPADIAVGCAGRIEDLLRHSDIVLDCTPRGTGAALSEVYRASRSRVIFQGGEKSATAGTSYCYGTGFEAAVTAPTVRVVSCNTTGLMRLARAISNMAPIDDVRATLTRSAADPDKSAKGRLNALIASPGESHHGIDIRELWPGLDIRTIASYAPVNCGHLASLFVRMSRHVTPEEIREALENAPRVSLVEGSGSLADLRLAGQGRRRRDCHDVIVWQSGIDVCGREVMLSAGIHMEAIVIPETIDVLYAMSGIETDRAAAMRRTDRALSLPAVAGVGRC